MDVWRKLEYYIKIIYKYLWSFMLHVFWPVSYLFDEKDKVKGSTFYIFQNISVFFSIIILVVYILKNYDRVKS